MAKTGAIFNIPASCLHSFPKDTLFYFGISPVDPISILTPQSQLLLQAHKLGQDTNIIVKECKLVGDTLVFLFQRVEGKRKINYWSKANSKEELIAAKSFYTLDTGITDDAEPRPENVINQTNLPMIPLSQEFLSH